MSYLQKQSDAFKSNLSSASSKLSAKRSVAPPVRTASPAPSPSGKSDQKRKRPDAPPAAFPSAIDNPLVMEQGKGQGIMTKVTYAVEYLKSKEVAQSLGGILSYLSISRPDEKRTLASILQSHDRVEYAPDPHNPGLESGMYRFRPKHNIHSAEDLLAYLQGQKTAQGIQARELREGWSGADPAIDLLDSQKKILVMRNRKDTKARMVWYNVPSLEMAVDDEFRNLWLDTKLPRRDAYEAEFARLNHHPTLTDKSGPRGGPVKAAQKKRKKPATSKKTTNQHLGGILKDYSHLRK